MRRCMLIAVLALGSAALAGEVPPNETPAAGEAHVWYLGHAGWLVRTAEHDLIFDFTGPIGEGGPDSGGLSPQALAGRRVVLFISHSHGDHFKRRVLDLRNAVEDLVVVMGWEEPGAGAVVVPPDGKWTEVSGARVFALHHEFDGIPEGFFLVRSGGLTIYHSGDHGTWSDPPNETFRANIDRLTGAADRIDLAFISAFGERGGRGALNAGDVYGIKTLKPRVTFPMHCGGCEEKYAAFAEEAAALELPTATGVAQACGSSFRYKDGALY